MRTEDNPRFGEEKVLPGIAYVRSEVYAQRFGDKSGRWLVVTTDSHVIHPVFFPGGDIGRLAVAGTVNDLAVMGATEVLALTFAVILEEGFRRADLERIQASLRATCDEAGARSYRSPGSAFTATGSRSASP